jgi:hypothetical protein
VIHPTYRHLDRRMRLFGLTIAQLAQLFAAGFAAYALLKLLPHGMPERTTVALVVPFGPFAFAYGAQGGDFCLCDQLASLARFTRRRGVYEPGLSPNAQPAGLVIEPQPRAVTPHAGTDQVTPTDLQEDLWR